MKDFSKLEEYLNNEGSIKTKDAIEIGYNNYDLKVYLNSNLIERIGHGVYGLKKKEEIHEEQVSTDVVQNVVQEDVTSDAQDVEQEETVMVDENRKRNLSYQGIKCIINKNYDEAIKIYEELIEMDINNGYYDFYLSYVYFLEEKYKEAYGSLMDCYNKSFKPTLSIYLVSLVLGRYVDIDSSVVNDFKNDVDFSRVDVKFMNRVVNPLENDNLAFAQKNLYYYLYGDRKVKKYNVGNQYLYSVVYDLMDKLGIEILDNKRKEIVVPEVQTKQVLSNTILLNAIDSGDFNEALDLVSRYEISDARETITLLVNKIKEIRNSGKAPILKPTKVVKSEEVVIYTPEVDSSVEVEKKEIISNFVKPTGVSNFKKADSKDDKEVQELIDNAYQEFKDLLNRYEFDLAKKALVRYDILLRTNLRYRDLTYYYERIERERKEFMTDREVFLRRKEVYQEALALVKNKNFEEALNTLEGFSNLEMEILRARIYMALDSHDEVHQIMKGIDAHCHEPNYYKVMAYMNFNDKRYKDALKYAILYNALKPKNPAMYVLMANCYEKIRKPGKAIKVLRKADVLNRENGANIDLSGRIHYNEGRAEKFREKRLLKNNKNNLDVDFD